MIVHFEYTLLKYLTIALYQYTYLLVKKFHLRVSSKILKSKKKCSPEKYHCSSFNRTDFNQNNIELRNLSQ